MSNMKINIEVKRVALISFGCLALSLGIVLFLIPNKIATGGTPGLAILLHFLVDLPTGILMVLINIPLLLAGAKLLGKGFAIRTIFAILLTSVLIDLFAEVLNLQALSHDTLLASLYGGIAIGVGVGLILKGDASAGGSTIIAKVVASRSQIKPGQVILLLDLLIIVGSGLVFLQVEQALWSLISIYATTKCIDMILTGTPSEKVVHISTDQVVPISKQIVAQLGQRGTILTGSGLVDGESKTLIFVTVEARRINLLREIIRDNDPQAFMVVMEAAEIQGRRHAV